MDPELDGHQIQNYHDWLRIVGPGIKFAIHFSPLYVYSLLHYIEYIQFEDDYKLNFDAAFSIKYLQIRRICRQLASVYTLWQPYVASQIQLMYFVIFIIYVTGHKAALFDWKHFKINLQYRIFHWGWFATLKYQPLQPLSIPSCYRRLTWPEEEQQTATENQ